MPSLRWLLVLDIHSHIGDGGKSYRLHLCELDEEPAPAPLICHTMDELFAALLARLDRQASSAAPHSPEEGVTLASE